MKDILVISGEYNYTVKTVNEEQADVDYSSFNFIKSIKIIERIWWNIRLPYFYIFFPFKKREIKKYKLIIMFECHYPVEVIQYIKKINPTCTLIYWLWNSIDKIYIGKGYSLPNEIRKLLKSNVKIYTFDKHDCENYGFYYNNQLGVRLDYKQNVNEYDVFFCGADKNRIELIRDVGEKLIINGLYFKCLLLPDERKKYLKTDERYLNKKFIDYEIMVKYEQASTCILDLVQNEQNGITWRPLEAMFYKKKLITNYREITKYDFYRKQNIFIIGEDDWSMIKSFISSEYDNIPENILEKYLWNGWINSIKNQNLAHSKQACSNAQQGNVTS